MNRSCAILVRNIGQVLVKLILKNFQGAFSTFLSIKTRDKYPNTINSTYKKMKSVKFV